ncbi:EpsG family protein [Flavobacterium pallidum]|uniref:EpsG family protein n=1 Tax=Flavobacterium pallidum TaxID=2172098 RepID=A0A2S1SDI1_9FLAO|nr:EpsG family protein [Flavobacterium pallidum]AWI24450.1 hypothetical protein HYN49_00280 [Flavobacterium pallidum]
MQQTTENTQKDDSLWMLILFLINPFFSLVFSIKNYLSRYSRNIVMLFCGFYGLTFYPVRESMDSFRHREDFVEWASQTDITFDQFASRLYSEDVKYVDVFMPLLKFVVSRFTDDVGIFYAILGLLFGYYLSRNIWLLVDHCKDKLTRNLGIVLFTVAFVIGPWEINSFRFWIGAQMFMFYGYNYLVLKKKRHLIGLIATPFIHFGFFFTLVVFAVYKLAGNRLHIYFMIFLASLVINSFPVVNIQSYIPETSLDALNKKTTSYTSDDYIEGRAEVASELNWYVAFKVKPLNFTTFLLIAFLYFRKRKELLESKYLSLLCFSLLLMSLSYAIMGEVPTFFRYFRTSLLMFYAFLFLFMVNGDEQWYKKFYPLQVFATVFYIIVEIRIWFDTATVDTFISNPIVAFISQTYICVINFIK